MYSPGCTGFESGIAASTEALMNHGSPIALALKAVCARDVQKDPVKSARRSLNRPASWSTAVLIVCLALGTTGAVLAQDDAQDRPFSQPMYLVHLSGTGTMDGPVAKDVYILYKVAPTNGVLVTPDGEGGTFNNSAELIGGSFGTLREVCAFASSQGLTKAASDCGCPQPSQSAAPPATFQSPETPPVFQTPGAPMLGSPSAQPSPPPPPRNNTNSSFAVWWNSLDPTLRLVLVLGGILGALGLASQMSAGAGNPPPNQQASIQAPCGQMCSHMNGSCQCSNACSKAKGNHSVHYCSGAHMYPACGGVCQAKAGCPLSCAISCNHAGMHRCANHM